MGDLIRMPYSEVTATLELLDRLEIKPSDFEVLRKASSWQQGVVGRVLRADSFLLSMLATEQLTVKVGFLESDFKKLAGDEETLRQILQATRGFAEIKPIEHLIDCDADPFVPKGWEVVEHHKGGRLKWDTRKVKLYLSKR
ncbi:MAG: hypothetical protein HY093_01110, partial [Candidatus Liptonbacteria bacterium]|nr:hypothetical protein [Candidatus Liptonbacteria bacterium]